MRMETYWFEVTVDDSFSVQELETLEESIGKTPNQCYTESLEVVLLYQFIEVHPVEGMAA